MAAKIRTFTQPDVNTVTEVQARSNGVNKLGHRMVRERPGRCIAGAKDKIVVAHALRARAIHQAKKHEYVLPREDYNERFFWNADEIALSKIKIPPTPAELRHASDVIAKTGTKFLHQ